MIEWRNNYFIALGGFASMFAYTSAGFGGALAVAGLLWAIAGLVDCIIHLLGILVRRALS